MLIAISERSRRSPPPPSQRDIDAISRTLRLLGCRVFEIPSERSEDSISVEDHLAYLPPQTERAHGIYNGFIPSAKRYREVYEACARRNIWLLNTPEECARALSLVDAYPYIRAWTPATHVLEALEDLEEALATVGLPAFLKGRVKSLKARGASACIAHTLEDAHRIARDLLAAPHHTLGQVVVRSYVTLAHIQTTPQGFPIGREYLVFVYKDEILAMGYYWGEAEDPMGPLTESQTRAVRSLALQASRALGVPYVVLDVGQTEAGDFLIVEPGDAQFAGLSQVDPLVLMSALVHRLGG